MMSSLNWRSYSNITDLYLGKLHVGYIMKSRDVCYKCVFHRNFGSCFNQIKIVINDEVKAKEWLVSSFTSWLNLCGLQIKES